MRTRVARASVRRATVQRASVRKPDKTLVQLIQSLRVWAKGQANYKGEDELTPHRIILTSAIEGGVGGQVPAHF